MREGTASRVTVADRPYSEFYDFYSISLENFGYHLVLHQKHFGCSKQLLVTVPCGEQTVEMFLQSKCRKTLVVNVGIQVVLLKIA
jgi:hypothetical protein